MRRTRLSPAVRQPGPQKIMSPDFSRLREDMGRLHHGIKRTHGAGVLYARYAPCLSRRNLQHFVSMARHDLNAQHRQNLRRIHWNIPNVAWSIDIRNMNNVIPVEQSCILIRCRTWPHGISSAPWSGRFSAAKR